ncbi:U1 small nuclear ribonucleoprotein C [Carpediemonas membranifera]|uniref:U1 small nuclear ribonucleoprotein C n=1 Tax=Carpediemonas membranifera TaxID=201153 RepID=A0A8J6ARU8_9EUKA|nr:U1 small nuclear ribonucleoprotein C [Carpediemonas membranifera]|eukprot:KAG9389820.1 U1 small nuclear ribonucleoprotein C [Carpediemonas membranifera]
MTKNRYYCPYCDVYLAHDSMSARRDHDSGVKHRENVINWYKHFMPPLPSASYYTQRKD